MKQRMIALRIIFVGLFVISSLSTATSTMIDKQTISTDIVPIKITTTVVIAEAGGPYVGTKCESIVFTGSVIGGCSPYIWDWDFGDGSIHSDQQNVTHQYTNDGFYTAILTVTDCVGDMGSDTASITISTPILVADANGPYDGFTRIPINFYGSASGGCPRLGCKPYNYSWNFGDGGSSTKQNPSYTYSSSGEYIVTFSVTDNKNDTSIDITTAKILGSDLDVDVGGPYYGEVDVPILFYSYVESGVPPYSYHWDFGDGSTSEEQNPIHNYSDTSPSAGFKVSLFVVSSDGKNGWDQTRAYIISGDTLIADINGPYYGVVSETIQFFGIAFGGTSPYSFSWDFGDGNTSTMQNPDHIYTLGGEYTIILTVADDEGEIVSDETTATIRSNNPPDKPEKVWGERSGKAGENYTYITNTTDPDGDYVYYMWDWGDKTNSSWLGPYGSGLIKGASHAWVNQGTYIIQVKAKDVYDFESEWSDPFEISMPKNKVINTPFFLKSLIHHFPLFEKIINQIL